MTDRLPPGGFPAVRPRRLRATAPMRRLVAETRRPATAVVREHATVLRLSRAMFRRTLEEYPHFARKLLDDLRSRVQTLSGELFQVKEALKRMDKAK